MRLTDETNDSGRASWVESAQGSDFPIQNLPLGSLDSLRHPGSLGQSCLHERFVF